jgi:hypothetical protein
MSNKKTIQINPELFKISGNKTRKNREKKELTLNPIVSPNNLKNKLLKRIKDHKTQETKGTSKIKTNINSNSSLNANSSESYTDEFYGALDYLSDLTKKQKTNEAKQRSINTKTLKNYQMPSISTNTNISLELPPELQEPIKSSNFIPESNDIFKVNYKSSDDVPYGCLKGGHKKTYREWKELLKPADIDKPDVIRPPTPPKKNIGVFLEGAIPIENKKNDEMENKVSREERLEQIKNKLKKIEDQETAAKSKSLDNFKNLEKQLSTPLLVSPLEELTNIDEKESKYQEIEEIIKDRNDKKESDKSKKFLKKTVRRKFTLGKSDKLKRVSVLIKNRQTRKNIINTQKELKKTHITDIKKYLREHGIIKVGSTCPPDILRKIFESAVLSGDITNINRETLLHNFLSSDKE